MNFQPPGNRFLIDPQPRSGLLLRLEVRKQRLGHRFMRFNVEPATTHRLPSEGAGKLCGALWHLCSILVAATDRKALEGP